MSILIERLKKEIREAIQKEPHKTFEQLAREFGVSRSTITTQARVLREQTGFQRLPRRQAPAAASNIEIS